MRAGRTPESESNTGATFERRVAAYFYAVLACEECPAQFPSEQLIEVALQVSYLPADVDDLRLTLLSGLNENHVYVQCKETLTVQASDTNWQSAIGAIYRAVRGDQPSPTSDRYLLICHNMEPGHEEGLTDLLQTARAHASPDSLRLAVEDGKGRKVRAALTAVEEGIGRHLRTRGDDAIEIDPNVLLSTLQRTRLWRCDLDLDVSRDRRDILRALQSRTPNQQLEEAEGLYRRFRDALETDGKSRAVRTFASLRMDFGGFDHPKPSPDAADASRESFLADSEHRFDTISAWEAFEALEVQRREWERGLGEPASSLKVEKLRQHIARALVLEGRAYLLLSLRDAHAWIASARRYLDASPRLGKILAFLALDRGDVASVRELVATLRESDKLLLQIRTAIHEERFEDAIRLLDENAVRDFDHDLARLDATYALCLRGDVPVEQVLATMDRLNEQYGGRTAVVLSLAERLTILTRPETGLYYSENAPASYEIVQRLASVTREIREMLTADHGAFEHVMSARLLAELLKRQMLSPYVPVPDQPPAYATRVQAAMIPDLVEIYFGYGWRVEGEALLDEAIERSSGDEGETLRRIKRSLQSRSDREREIEMLPDFEAPNPLMHTAIVREACYSMFDGEWQPPEEWTAALEGTENPFRYEVALLMALGENRWPDASVLLRRLIARFPEAIDVYARLGPKLKEAAEGPTERGDADQRNNPEWGQTDDLEPRLRLYSHAGGHLGMEGALVYWINLAYSAKSPEQMRLVAAAARNQGRTLEEALAEALGSGMSGRYGNALDAFDRYLASGGLLVPVLRWERNRCRIEHLPLSLVKFDLAADLAAISQPREAGIFVEKMREENDLQGAYEVAREVLKRFPDHPDALGLMVRATLGSDYRKEGMVALGRLVEEFPDQNGIRAVSLEDAKAVFQEQEDAATREQALYVRCEALLLLMGRSPFESWYRQRELWTGVQVSRQGLEGRPGAAYDLGARPLHLDLGAVLQASRLQMWDELRQVPSVKVHATIRRSFRNELQRLRSESTDEERRVAVAVRNLLKAKNVVDNRFSDEEFAASPTKSYGDLEDVAVSLRSLRRPYIPSDDVEEEETRKPDAVDLRDLLKEMQSAGRIGATLRRRILTDLGLADEPLRPGAKVALGFRVLIEPYDLLRLVKAGVADDLIRVLDEVVILPSTRHGLSLLIGRTLALADLIEHVTRARDDLERMIREGAVKVIGEESRFAIHSTEAIKDLVETAEGEAAVVWTDEAMLRALLAGEAPHTRSVCTQELIVHLHTQRPLEEDVLREWCRAVMVDGHRDPIISGALVLCYDAAKGWEDPEFQTVVSRLGHILAPASSRTQAEFRHSLGIVAELVADFFLVVGRTELQIMANLGTAVAETAGDNGGTFVEVLLSAIHAQEPASAESLLASWRNVPGFSEGRYKAELRRTAKTTTAGTVTYSAADGLTGLMLRTSRNRATAREDPPFPEEEKDEPEGSPDGVGQ